ncbi:MAG: hypothetical protein ABSH19_04075 [Opitutales bacterium]|jgi:hypothetical protein
MESVEQIEAAIDRLPPAEFSRLADWVATRRQAEWVQEMERDAKAGKLDFLFEEAAEEQKGGTLRDWPSASR